MKVLVALYDRVTEAFAPIMTCHTRGEAIRSFRQECQNKESPIHKNPTDYELYVLGSYNDLDGKIEPTCERIARAEDHIGG
jgi:hypothetical protein